MTTKKSFTQIVALWKTDKKQYVKKSTFSAYVLLIENHLLPVFGSLQEIEEQQVQKFVFQKLEQGLSQKSIKDILIVLKMVLKFGAKTNGFPTSHLKFNILQFGKVSTLRCFPKHIKKR